MSGKTPGADKRAVHSQKSRGLLEGEMKEDQEQSEIARASRDVPDREFEQLKHRLDKIEDKIRRSPKDVWDRLQVLGVMLIPGALALAGFVFNCGLQDRQAQQETMQLIMDTNSQREMADSQIRATMFEALLSSYFAPGELEVRDKLTLLHLMQTNFVEYFNARPLFVDLLDQIDGKDDEESMKKKMRQAAKAIVDRQEVLLAENLTRLRIPVGDSTGGLFKVGDHEMTVEVTDLSDDRARVLLLDGGPNFPDDGIAFDVYYYDMPLVDYTTLRDGHRFALTFKGKSKIEGNEVALLNAFEFDKERLLPRDRPTIESTYSSLQALRARGSADTKHAAPDEDEH